MKKKKETATGEWSDKRSSREEDVPDDDNDQIETYSLEAVKKQIEADSDTWQLATNESSSKKRSSNDDEDIYHVWREGNKNKVDEKIYK